MIGNPDSWDQTTSFSGKGDYKDCIWSPCGRFVAARTEDIVEIRNPLTFQLLAVLQSPTKNSLLKGPLAYSPDGRSLACGFAKSFVVWDIQTGGVVRSIYCISDVFQLVWSLDGKTIATAHYSTDYSSPVNTYDVASGAQVFSEIFRWEWPVRLWACEKSFRFLSIPISLDSGYQLSISEIGPTRVKIEQFSVAAVPPVTVEFSPSTSRIAISGPNTLHISDARNSQSLLQENNIQSPPSFSSDASFVTAPHQNGFRVWKYTPGSYVLLGEYFLPHIPSFSPDELHLNISPTTTSILSRYKNVLQVWHLHGQPITPKARRQHAAISRSGRYIAVVHGSRSIVAIINLRSQAPSQFIDTGGEIEGLAITGNVLLVAFSQKVVGWLLTEEGRVNGLADSQRAGHSDSIWTISSPPGHPKSSCFRASGQVGVIGTEDFYSFPYHIDTGGVSYCVHKPQDFPFPWVSLYQPSDYKEYHHLRHHDTPQHDAPPADSWLVSRTTTGKAGWVVDPEGRHRFWVPVEWRAPWDPENCHHDITTLFTKIGDQPVMIKF